MNISCDTRSDFSVRIVVADYYMAPPISEIDVTYSEFRAAEIKYVPVLRVFGPSVDGRKACIHIHGVFPYFYIPCATPRPEPQLLYQIAASLDKALNISLKQASSMDHHVYKISLVKGIPFYGFHDKEHLFFKVFLYNPGLLKQAAELCQNGAILNQVFQPHEAHLNFTLQFFIDFNLFGMSLLHLQKIKHRTKLDDVYNEVSPISISDNIVKRVSKCYYEVDCLAAHIINRQRIGKGDGIENPGLEGIWNEEMERRKQLNVSLNPNITASQHRDFTETESHIKYLNMFFNKISDVVEKPVPTSGEMQAEIAKLRFQADLPNISYPAENIHDSQLLSASDVTFHHCDDTFNTTITNTANTFNDSIVNENIVLNCTLTQADSQVSLDIDDMELVDLLQNMDNQVEDDSILGTQSSAKKQDAMGSDSEDSDFEYTQVFNEEIDLQEKYENNEKSSHKYTGTQTPWPDDSFWDGVGGIPQLDGAFDEDEHTKKVRKKGRMKCMGLSKTKRHLSSIKNEKTENSDTGPKVQIKMEELELKGALRDNREIIKHEEQDMGRTRAEEHNTTIGDSRIENRTKDEYKVEKCLLYDIECDFEPQPGPSTMNNYKILPDEDIINSSMDSTPEALIRKGNLGITSFYDVSHIFDRTLAPEEEDVNHDFSISSLINKNEKKLNISSSNESINLDDSGAMKLRVTGLTLGSSKTEDVKTPATFQSNVIISPRILPPSRLDVISSLKTYDIPETKNVEPFYSNPNDVSKGIEVGQMLLKLSSNTTAHLKPFDNILKDITSIEEWRKQTFLQHTGSQDVDVNQLNVLLASNEKCILTPVQLPPSSKSVCGWLKDRQTKIDQSEASVTQTTQDYSRKFHDDFDDDFKSLSSSITNSGSLFHMSESPTKSDDITLADHVSRQPDGSFLCFGSTTKHSPDTPASIIENDFLTVMTLEVLTNVRGDLHPDPLHDSIAAIFYTITNDCPASHFLSRTTTEAVVISSDERKIDFKKTGVQTNVIYVNNENDLIHVLIAKTKINDPDIICGYEIEMNSWGYVLERAQTLGINLLPEISRVPSLKKHQNRIDDRNFEGKVIGRIIFSVWRLLRHELAMSSYSFESTMYQILKERVPTFTYRSLYEWWNESTHLLKWMTVEYFLTKLSGTVRIMEKLDFINRTSELARLFGLQWWEVLSRGTQFRVESLMLRAARPLNLLALSPSVRQRAAMRAPECLPLIFEPKSRFYSDPVIVLDFQSLYPSMMIAYNYCFSTCIGKIQNMKGDTAYEMGAWQLRISKEKLEKLVSSNLVHWSPVGAGFVRAEARRGVLPALLTRILAARQAVKKSAKLQTDESVKKAMHSRQLGLKLIANVTYGYTAANFSGRMPCVEVGDSVVSKGRETLERAIKLVENNESWNAEVLYGDTDSMFVLVRGSRERAFEVGAQIAAAVTADNPPPVALKLEKVYQPCILQTKKRYVGFMYENPEQEQPQYEAKGIETVRRDGCPAGVKLLESVLCELFTSRDVSKVKRLVCDALSRLLEGRMPLSQLMFTREYNGPTGYRPGAHAPPLEIARRIARVDKRAVPLTASRVSWVVCAGAPGLPLMKLSHTAQEMFLDASLRPHVTYYITRVLLPPLARCLSLIGADVFQWYSEMPRRPDTGAGGIVAFLSRDSCASCGQRHGRATARRHGRATAICVTCQQRPDCCVPILMNKLLRHERHVQMCQTICMSCCSNSWSYCSALECPVLWRRRDAAVQLEQSRDVVQSLPLELCDNTMLQF